MKLTLEMVIASLLIAIKPGKLFSIGLMLPTSLVIVIGLFPKLSWGATYECIENGGAKACLQPVFESWRQPRVACRSINLLADAGIFCRNVLEGTGDFGLSCTGQTPVTDINYIDRIKNYGISYMTSSTEMNYSDWYIPAPDEKNCLSYRKNILPKFVNSVPTFIINKFTFTNPENRRHQFMEYPFTVIASKSRTAYCPEGSMKRSVTTIENNKIIECVLPNPKHLGCSASVGNPCSVTTGNKFLSETDWISANSPLTIRRFYNSLSDDNSGLSAGWTHNYAMTLSIGAVQSDRLNIKPQSLEEPTSVIVLKRADGKRVLAVRDYADTTIAGDSGWFIDREEGLKLEQMSSNKWQVTHVDTGQIETYESLIENGSEPSEFALTRIDYLDGQYVTLTYGQGRLYQATDNFGRTLAYEYSDNSGINGISAVTLPSGQKIQYTKQGHELKVTRPGYGTKIYLYDEPEYTPNSNGLITGIIDENGDRYATYAYDEQNRGISTEHADGTQKYTLSYNNSSTIVNTPYGGSKTYTLGLVSGGNKVIRTSQSGGDSVSNQYDQAGNLILQNDNGITTKYTYDLSRNLQTSQINSSRTPESTITLTEWAAGLPVKTKVTEGTANIDGSLKESLRITSYTHNERGNVLSKTIADPLTNQSRTWTYTYNQYSQKTSETDPQGLTQTWVYDTNNGNLLSYTNNQGLITTYSDHTSDGNPQTITEASGQVKAISYDEAGRIMSQTVTIIQPELADLSQNQSSWSTLTNSIKAFFNASVAPNPVKYDITQQVNQVATTTYDYDAAGQLISVVLPDGETITYQYDDAHRMIGMTDSLGNRIRYTLNGAGDIIQTDRYDPQGVLSQSGQQSFDILGRLKEELGNNGQKTTFSYDKQDNLIQTQDALSRIDRQSYDHLGRIIQDIDAESNQVKYQYNGLGQLIAVTDSRGNTTRYTINAFGEITQINSPDTGITTFEFSDSGQLTRQVDAVGRVKVYQYDEKGRFSNITDSQGSIIATYNYDDIGLLTNVTNSDNSTSYIYDSAGRIVEKVQHIKAQTEQQNQTVRYHYTAGGKIDEMRLPSGKLIVYEYDQGILQGIQVKHDDNTTQVIDGITYSLEGINGFNWSQIDQAVSHIYDLDGRLTQIKDPAITRDYQYDVGNRITAIVDGTANIDYRYEHDKIDRLLKQNLQQTSLTYAYDRNSNRTQNKVSKEGIVDITSISYSPDSNRIIGVTYDASGRITNDGTRAYTYNSTGRIERIQNGAVGIYNTYDPLGQRIQKNSGSAKTYFSYNEQGQLIGEYDQDNNAIREYIYLGGQPIAMLSNQKDGDVLQIHTDHLGTPRAVTDKDNIVLWRWEGDAFGTSAPNIATIKMPLRMAGQYADDETGLFYNYYRFYNPKTGRYVTSDPLGLTDGTNSYNYVYGNPLSYVDPTGEYGVGGAIFGAGLNVAIQAGLNYAATGNLSRSLLCLDLADIALSAALGAAGPGVGNLIKKPVKGAVFTRRENAFVYMFMVQPASMGSKRVLNFTVDDLRRKFSDDECNDTKCDKIALPEKHRLLSILQF